MFDLSQPLAVDGLALFASGDTTHDPQSCRLSGSASATGGWTVVANFTAAAGTALMQTFFFPAAEFRFWRLDILTRYSPFQAFVAEVMFHPAQSANAPVPLPPPSSASIYTMPFHYGPNVYSEHVTYLPPTPTADPAWVQQVMAEWDALPLAAAPAVYEAVDDFDRFTDMESPASEAEVQAMLARFPDDAVIFIPEDRFHAVRMLDALVPFRWTTLDPSSDSFVGETMRGQWFSFQIGVFTARAALRNLSLSFGDFSSATSAVPGSAFLCINTDLVTNRGEDLHAPYSLAQGLVGSLWVTVNISADTPPGLYAGNVRLTSADFARNLTLTFQVTPTIANFSGDDNVTVTPYFPLLDFSQRS